MTIPIDRDVPNQDGPVAILQSLKVATQYSVFCSILFIVIMGLSPKTFRGKTFSKEIMLSWYSRAVSIVHALAMFGRSVYYWIYINPTMAINSAITPYQATTMDIMVGYLLYDTFFESFYGEGGLILGHHLAGLLTHSLGRYFQSGRTGFYLMMVYIAELSTPFLHCCWLLKQLNITNSLMTMCGAFLIICFFGCRILLSPFLIGHMWLYWSDADIYMFYINFAAVIFFLVMNFYWFYLLVKLVFFPGRKKKKQSSNKETKDE